MYECFHCGSRSVVWSADFTFSDYGYDGNGLIHVCNCSNCGAEIEYRIPMDDDEEEDDYYTDYHSGDSNGTGKGK